MTCNGCGRALETPAEFDAAFCHECDPETDGPMRARPLRSVSRPSGPSISVASAFNDQVLE